mgnify:CR=1 FL=1
MPSQTYTTPGVTNWTAQATSVIVECWGGGGGGAGSTTPPIDYVGCAGAGGGGYAKKIITGLTIGNNYSVCVGAGGTSTPITDGGQSYFINGATVSANGGTKSTAIVRGTGGTGNGTIAYTGGMGGFGWNEYGAPGGGGGSSAGTGAVGGDGGNATVSVAGTGGVAPTGGGAGGDGDTWGPSGLPGVAPGGGGGGGSEDYTPGGAGAAGKVVLTWETGSPSQSPSASPSASASQSPSASPSESPSASPSIPILCRTYRALETPITFKDGGGSVIFTLSGLSANAKRISARYDRGAGSLPFRYKWRGVFRWAATPVAGDYAELYLSGSDGVYADGGVGSDVPIVDYQIWNCSFIGCVYAQTATGGTNNIASGIITILDRYFSIGVWNYSNIALQNTSNVNFIILTPIAEEIRGA